MSLQTAPLTVMLKVMKIDYLDGLYYHQPSSRFEIDTYGSMCSMTNSTMAL